MAAVAFQSPKYVQSAGALKCIGDFVKESFPDAKKAGIITSKRLRARYMESLCQTVASPLIAEFQGECSRSNLRSILGKLQSQQLDYIVGFGGGKLLDMAKLVSEAWVDDNSGVGSALYILHVAPMGSDRICLQTKMHTQSHVSIHVCCGQVLNPQKAAGSCMPDTPPASLYNARLVYASLGSL